MLRLSSFGNVIVLTCIEMPLACGGSFGSFGGFGFSGCGCGSGGSGDIGSGGSGVSGSGGSDSIGGVRLIPKPILLICGNLRILLCNCSGIISLVSIGSMGGNRFGPMGFSTRG